MVGKGLSDEGPEVKRVGFDRLEKEWGVGGAQQLSFQTHES